MADGASGNIGGILFEAGKTISDAGKKQAQQIANSVAGQVTGNAKPLFGGGSNKPLGQLGNDFGKMFEGGKPGFGPKKPPVPQTPQFSQQQLDDMAAQNKATDEQEIAKRQAELEQIKLQHKQLHNEMYYNAIRDAGKDAIAKERKAKAQEEKQQEEEKAQQQAQAGQDILPGNPLSQQNQQFGTPIAVQQAQRTTEANRGTTG